MLIDFDDINYSSSKQTTQQNQKITITLIYEDKDSQISWDPKTTSLKDAKFMFLCSCDALADGEFEILDIQAKPVDINALTSFQTGSVFYLRKKEGNKVSNILLDGKRKLYVEIEPLRHIEAQAAIKYMCIGSNLLKHTKKGFPHIRLFQLSNDLKRILWYTKSKKIDEAQVLIESIRDLTIGQISETFEKYPVKMLEDFSFSIYYKNKYGNEETLDLTCKNEKEFDLWVIGIKALHSHVNNKVISKNDLLYHSRSYNEQIKKGNIGKCTKFLTYNNTLSSNTDYNNNNNNSNSSSNSKSLESFLTNRNLTPLSLCRVLLKLCNKLNKLRDDIEELKEKDVLDSNKNNVNDDGYEEIFNEEVIVDDLDTQKCQMITLFTKCEKELTLSINEFFIWEDTNHNNSMAQVAIENKTEFNDCMLQLKFHFDSFLPSNEIQLDNEQDKEKEKEKVMSEHFMKELDIKTWKIEVDLENVGDIIKRFKCLGNKGFLDTLKDLFKGLI